MPHDLDLILTITGGLTAALALGYVTQRLKLSPIVGYLLAGIVVGPFTPGFVADREIAPQLAELGVILLMFGVGTHFKVEELLAVRKIAIPGALVQIAVATALGVGVTTALGWELGGGIVLGLAVAVASTVVLLRVLADNDALHTPAGHVAVGWLLVEDVFTVLVLVMLPLVAGSNEVAEAGGERNVTLSVAMAIAKIGLLVVFTVVFARRAIPKLLEKVARTRSRELFTLTVLVLALGIAVGSSLLFGASMALGAFLAGLVVGQSEFGERAASEALPMRDAFAVLFFVSMGMLFDPLQVGEHLALTLAVLAVILIGKPLAALAVMAVLRRPPRMALTVAISLAQIGEFSFILAELGRQIGILPAASMQALVAASIVSITLNPLLFRMIEPLAARLPAWGGEAGREPDRASGAHQHRAIVVGYGPVGRAVTDLLRDNGVEPTIVELNLETVRALREQGLQAIYGDAAQAEILERAGAKHAISLIFAASTSPDAVIRAAKELNGRLRVFARATYASQVRALRSAGVDEVIAAETEVALAMVEQLLRRLGATDDQLDRARDRVRSDMGEPG